MSRPTPQSGFSLIEVVIALAVLAIALSALINSTSSATANTISLRSMDRIAFDSHQSLSDLEQRIREALITGNRDNTDGMHQESSTGKMNR